MKASQRQQQLLLQLQEYDTEMIKIARRSSQLPERAEIRESDDSLAAAKQAFLQKQSTLEEINAELARLESDLDTVLKRKKLTTERLEQSVQAKEASALQDELAVLENRKRVLEDREMEQLELAETAQQEHDAAFNEISGIDSAVAKLRERLAAKEAELNAERIRIETEREGLAAEIQGDLKEVYERLRERYGIGVARLEGRVSGGSNMELDAADYAAAMATPADELYYCPSSGVILVRDTES